MKPYRCSAGALTIGVGRNLDDRGITEHEALYLLDNDITRVQSELDVNIPSWRGLSDARQMVLMDMCFNLGISRFLKFKRMLAALRDGDYETAAREALLSKWADQVGQRARTLAEMMRRG